MVRRESEMLIDINEQMRGGVGSVEITHIFKKDELKGKARLCARITINPGNSIGLHQHDNEEEIYYIISGRGLVEDNGNKKEISANDAVLTGGGEFHSIENIGDEPLVLLAVILLY